MEVNYALVAALYDSNDSGLYKEIYFPITRYVIAKLHADKPEARYIDISDVQQQIEESFGLRIPVVVLRKSIQAISKENNGKEITIVDDKLQIIECWSESSIRKINDSASDIKKQTSKISLEYKTFVENEGWETTRTFEEFISENMRDIVTYYGPGEVLEKIDESYTPVASFLDYLKGNNAELFKVATKIFWSSVIAGFLSRESTEVKIGEPNETIDYYLDTSLVMAAIDLSTERMCTEARELVEVIISAGAVPRVHPITVMEVSNIISAVEAQGAANPITGIYDAYVRRKLSPSSLANIRVNLKKLIKGNRIELSPIVNDHELNNQIYSLRDKKIVKELGKSRTYKYEYEEEQGNLYAPFRDVHDVYMYDFIKEQQKKKKTDKIYFITTNNDLIKFFKDKSDTVLLVHPGIVLMDLWMYGAQSKKIESKALTFTVSRCVTLNNRDVKFRMNKVAHYCNNIEIDDKTYKTIIRGLVKRSSKMIVAVDTMNERDFESVKSEKINALISSAKELEERMNTRNSDLQERLYGYEDKLSDKEEQIQKLTAELDRTKEREELRKQKDDLQNSLAGLNNELAELGKEREKYVSFKEFYISYGIIIFFFLLFVSLLIYCLCSNVDIKALIGSIFSLVLSTGTCLFKKGDLFSPKQYKDKIKTEQMHVWEENHPRYSELLSLVGSKRKEYDEVCKKLNALNQGE